MLELLEGRRIVVCAGSGGVGKTTGRRDRDGDGRARPEGRGRHHRPGEAARGLARARGARQRAAARRRPVRGRAVGLMLDSKRTFDALIERLAPDEATRDEVLEPHLPSSPAPSPARRSSRRSPSSTSSTRRATTTCWCSTAALAQRARLPRRPGAAGRLLPGPRDQDVPAAGGPGQPPARARHRRRVRADGAAHRGRPAARPVGVLPRAQRHDRRVHRAREPRRRAARGPGHDVPDHHRAAPRPGRGGDLLPPQARRRLDAVRRARRQPPARRAGAERSAPGRARREPGSAGGHRRARGRGAGRARGRDRRAAAQHARRPADDPRAELDGDVHDVEGLRASARTCSLSSSPARARRRRP